MYNKSHNYRLNPISDTLQLVWQIVSLKSLSLQPFGRDGRGDGRRGDTFPFVRHEPRKPIRSASKVWAQIHWKPRHSGWNCHGNGPLDNDFILKRRKESNISPVRLSPFILWDFLSYSRSLIFAFSCFPPFSDSNLDYMPFHFYKTHIICFIKELGGITVEPCDCRKMSDFCYRLFLLF